MESTAGRRSFGEAEGTVARDHEFGVLPFNPDEIFGTMRSAEEEDPGAETEGTCCGAEDGLRPCGAFSDAGAAGSFGARSEARNAADAAAAESDTKSRASKSAAGEAKSESDASKSAAASESETAASKFEADAEAAGSSKISSLSAPDTTPGSPRDVSDGRVKTSDHGEKSDMTGSAATHGDPEESLSPEDEERYRAMSPHEGDVCPHCGRGTLLFKQTQRSASLVCSRFPSCRFRLFTAAHHQIRSLLRLESLCPECGSALEVKTGRFGTFIGCSHYPDCGYVFRRKEESAEKVPCPACGKGELVKRTTGRGRSFYGCSTYPACDFLVNGRPVAQTCEDCGFPIGYERRLRSGKKICCANSLCPSRRRRRRAQSRAV